MQIRAFCKADIDEIVSLFYDTVHTINRGDYSKEQVEAWEREEDRANRREAWLDSLQRNLAYVAERDGIITGFSDMTTKGYLDRMFVHKDFQGRGIATALLRKLEEEAARLELTSMFADVSLTARPFFERHGFNVMQARVVERGGVALNNFRMEKALRGVRS
ncbi:GNAT family N-acetyltransferase [Paenibacillus sp. HB172176]|uniref:GNAT family N-acetyltransferase n=1 Tax=Paenibacillus sp. HB172176 TaxID=2493690 RepID=UPI0014398DD7|nr:GNAT family N-acetyltransferase [Paenibacillus sp. HB172176]